MKKLYLALFISFATYNFSYGQCSANFEASINPICVGQEVYFTNLTTGVITSYNWGFGTSSNPGTFAAENPPNITYSTSGTKTVSLTVTCTENNSLSCTGTSTGGAVSVVVVVGVIVTVTTSILTSTVTTTCVPLASGMFAVTSIRETSVRVVDVPAPTITPSTLTACTNDPIDFTGSPSGASSYSWNFGSGASPGTSNEQNPSGIVYSTSGTKNVTLTVSNGTCEETASTTVTITSTPTASFSSTAPACTGEAVDFINTGTGTITSSDWTFGTTSSPANSTTTDQAGVTYSSGGSKTITLTNNNGACSASVIGVITIYQAPTAAITVVTAARCTGTPINFTGDAGVAGNWRYSWDFGSGATPSTSSSQNPTGIVYSTADAKMVTLTVYDSYCSNTTTNSTITIVQTPTASFTSNAPVCTGQNVDFTNTGTGTITSSDWTFGTTSSPANSTSTDQAGVTYTSAGPKTITLTNNNGACNASVTGIINIYQSPDPRIGTLNSVCTQVKINFRNASSIANGFAWRYSWDFGAGAIPQGSTSENPDGVYYTSSGLKTITLTIFNNNCSQTITTTLNITQTPTADFSSTAPQCTGLPVDFINLGSTGVELEWAWNFGFGAVTATSVAENPTGVIYTTAGNKIVQQITTNRVTGCADTSTQSIIIHQTPTASFTSDAPKCVGDPVAFTNTAGNVGGSWMYFWDFGQDAFPQTATAENPAGVAYSTGGTKTVTFTVFDKYCSRLITQPIVINALPIVNAGRDTTICANTTVQIGSATIAGNTYSWFAPVTLSVATISNPVATPIAHITQYIVTVRNTNSCVNRDTIVVTMLDPIQAHAGVDKEICRYDSVQIGVGLVEQQLYVWTPAAGLSSTTLPNPVSSPDFTTTYTVTVTYSGKACDAVTDEVTVLVRQLPLIEAGTVRYQPSPNDSTTINDTITLGSSIQLIAIGGLQYTWEPPYRLDNVGIFNPIANPDTTTTYIVTGIDIYGCVNNDTVIIKLIIPSFWVPTAFTPNGNGENEVFYVRGSGIQNFELGIFNRWGEQIFLSKLIEQGWDGTRPISGEELPAGAYVYYIKGKLTDETVIDTKGLINLIR